MWSTPLISAHVSSWALLLIGVGMVANPCKNLQSVETFRSYWMRTSHNIWLSCVLRNTTELFKVRKIRPLALLTIQPRAGLTHEFCALVILSTPTWKPWENGVHAIHVQLFGLQFCLYCFFGLNSKPSGQKSKAISCFKSVCWFCCAAAVQLHVLWTW